MKSEILGIKGAGKKCEGEILFLGNEEITISFLDKRITGKIIGGRIFGKTALFKAEALDVAGVVLSDITDEVFAQICQGKNWEIGEPCSLSLPLLVVNDSDLTFLKLNQGKKAILDPGEKKLTLCL